MRLTRRIRGSVLLPFLVPISVAAAAATPPWVVTVSPGESDRAVAVATACPTFSWGNLAGADRFEVIVLDLAASEERALVLRREVAGSASSWTPGGAHCLAAGREYGWSLRALDAAGQPLGGKESWAALRRFTVPAAPSAEEVAAALEVLRRFQASSSGSSAPTEASSSSSCAPAGKSVAGVTVSGVAAVRGEMPGITGETYGVFGISNSPQGAGLAALNSSAGPDLILDGSFNGQADTLFTQSGIDRPSGGAQTFNVQNSGAGAMTLQVDGVAVDTSSTVVAWSRLGDVPAGFADGIDNDTLYTAGNQLTLAGSTFSVLEGPGSGLDADTLDGSNGASYQLRVTGVCPAGQTMQGINADGTVACTTLNGPPLVTTVDDPANDVGWYTSLAIGTNGFPVISYHDFTDQALKVTKCSDAACAGANETITTVDDSANNVGQYTSIAIGTDRFPVISYYDQTVGTLKVAKCNDAACAPGGETITTVDNPANDVGAYTSIAIGTDGYPVISYYDSTAGALKVAKCNDAACAPGGETITTVDDPLASSVGAYTSIAIGTDGFPVISYYNSTAQDLKVAKCNDAACAGANETITTADSPTYDVGRYTSIAIGTDGFPVISYWDGSGGALKVAKCNDAACAGANETITTVDDPGNNVGRYTSLAIGTDGFPVISYYDDTANTLKVIKCFTRSCFAP